MTRMRTVLVATMLLSLLGACGGDPEDSAPPTPTESSHAPVDLIPTLDDEPDLTVSGTRREFPKGYPKVVNLSSLPDQVRHWYEADDDGTGKALAIAPGVWAQLPPGATPTDAVDAEVFDGFCASKKAYERQYRYGRETAGTCW